MNLTILLDANIVPEQIQEVKESLAMFLEQWGDVKIVGIREEQPAQISMTGFDITAKSQTFGNLPR